MRRLLIILTLLYFCGCISHGGRYLEHQQYIVGELDRIQSRIVTIDSLWLNGKLSHDELIALLQMQVTSIEIVLLTDRGLRTLDNE